MIGDGNNMNEEKALKILNISEAEAETLTVVKLSRAFARAKQNVSSDDDFEELYEAFEYAKENLVGSKKKTAETSVALPASIFPTVNIEEEQQKGSGLNILALCVDGVPNDVAVVQVAPAKPVFVLIPRDAKNGDSVTFAYDKEVYGGKLLFKRMTKQEVELARGAQNA